MRMLHPDLRGSNVGKGEFPFLVGLSLQERSARRIDHLDNDTLDRKAAFIHDLSMPLGLHAYRLIGTSALGRNQPRNREDQKKTSKTSDGF